MLRLDSQVLTYSEYGHSNPERPTPAMEDRN